MCWSLWHLPLIFTLYTPEAPILGIILRSIHIVGISIFLGYLYIKTKNIWFCAIIHVLNNSAFLITNSKESTITYHDILIVSMVVLIFYVPFLFLYFCKFPTILQNTLSLEDIIKIYYNQLILDIGHIYFITNKIILRISIVIPYKYKAK